MSLFERRPTPAVRYLLMVLFISFIQNALGCASPGPPHAPSLHLPKQVSDLSARRIGDRVELHFTAPLRTTDNLPLDRTALTGMLCRQLGNNACILTGNPHPVAPSRPNARNGVMWVDVLPPELQHGNAHLLGYRVELFNAAKQSAGKSDAAFTVSGDAPPPVAGLQAEGSRLGVLLHWKPAPRAQSSILISREDLTTPSKQSSSKRENSSNTAELLVSAADAVQNRVLDATARPERAYRYTAARRTQVSLGGRSLELSSAPSEAIAFELHLVYPPPAPTELTAAGFATEATATAHSGFAVDLIWQPVEDAGLLAGLAGYNVYREGPATRVRLNAAPVPVPAFHDATASAVDRYIYSVTAVDGKGNESAAVSAIVEQNTKP